MDGLNLPRVRFARSNPAEHFYLHAIRFDEMFAQLVLPLRDHRSLHLEADYVEETAAEYQKHTYEFEELECHLTGRHLPAEAGLPILQLIGLARVQLRDSLEQGGCEFSREHQRAKLLWPWHELYSAS